MRVEYQTSYTMEPDGSHTEVIRPLLPVRIIGRKAGGPPVPFRMDTGADDILIPDFEARFLGVALDESQRVPLETLGRGGSAIYGTVDLAITDGQTTWRWSARVGFHDGPPQLYVLGHNGFLRHFTATFDGWNRDFTLAPNGTFPRPMSQAL